MSTHNTRRGHRNHAKLPDPDELRWLLDAGETVPLLADRYGVRESAIERALLRDRSRDAVS